MQSEHHRLPPGNNVQNALITVTASGVCSFLSGLMSIFTFISSLVLQPTSSQDRAAGGHLGQLMSDPPNKAVHWAKQQTNWDPTLASAVVEACQPREWLLPRGMFPSISSIHTDTHLLHSARVKAAQRNHRKSHHLGRKTSSETAWATAPPFPGLSALKEPR